MDDQTVQKLCHMLASCEESTRSQALNSISELFSEVTCLVDELKLLKLTKALYFMLWLTDKPLKVRKVAVTIADSQSHFVDRRNRFAFFDALFKSMSMEWPNLDKNRVDKMLLFVRIVLAALLELLNNGNWDLNEINRFNDIVLNKEGIFHKRSAGLAFQFIQVFFEEFEANRVEFDKTNSWSELSAIGYLHLMKPFLHLILLNDNRHLLKTLYMYVLSRAADIAGVPTDGYKVLLNRFSQTSFASKYNVKLVLEPLLEQFSEIDCSEDELDAHAKEVVASMEASLNDAGNNHAKPRKTKKSDVADEEDVAPSLVDVTDELEADDYSIDEEDDGYISLAEAFTPRKSNRKFGKHLKEIATLDTLRKYLLSSKQDKHHLLDKLNSPRLRRQMTLLSLHNIRLLNPDRRFKCARKLHRIMTITDTVQNMPSKRRSIDVAKALHNIKHAKPEKSIVRKRKSKVTEPKHVVFNLKNNQVATIPKKAKSTLTMPMWY